MFPHLREKAAALPLNSTSHCPMTVRKRIEPEPVVALEVPVQEFMSKLPADWTSVVACAGVLAAFSSPLAPRPQDREDRGKIGRKWGTARG